MTDLAIPEDQTAASNGDNHLYLVDGSGYIFRAFHALPSMNRSDGTPTNAVFGFTNMLLKLVEDIEADHVAVIFDTKRLTFRNEIFADYKANRDEPPEDLRPQFSLIRDAVRAFNVPCLEMEGYEADDLIATYARQAKEKGMRVTIVSSDKDLMQLVDDGVDMYDPMKNRAIGRDEVFEKFGVGPEKVVDVQSLAGDSVDNVPGVPGIGIKTAAQLINEYGDLDTLLARAEEIKQPKRRQNLIEFAEQARISRELVRLKDDVSVEEPLERLTVEDPDDATVLSFLKEMEFKRLIARFEAELSDGGAASAGGGPVEGSVGSPSPEGDVAYELVQEIADLERWIALARAEGTVAVDTETSSLNAMRAELVGVSMSVVPGKACYIPLGHTDGEAQGSLLGDSGNGDGPKQIPRDKALGLLKPLFEDPSVLKVLHNAKYDLLVLARGANGGVNVTPVDDTMCMSYVLEGGLHGHGLDELSELHFGHTNIKFADVCGKGKTQIPFSAVALDKALDYAAEDADMTVRLHRTLRPELPKAGLLTVYETLERPLIPVLTRMEKAGIKVDPQILRDMSKDFEKRLDELAVEIHKLAGEEFNIGSPKQLGEILFDRMGLPGGKKGKTGAYATGAEILEDLAAQGHDLPARVLDWRQLSKLKSTYTDALVEAINPETGRIHTSYSMTGASTGRLSSNDPNLQNIPIRSEEGRKIRTAFVAEPGNKLLAVDYSQIELRLVAHIANIESLKQAFRDGIDIHAQTASEVFGVPLAEMDPITRRNAKAINFGIIYGISAFGLARQIGTEPGVAKKYIDAYFERFPGIRDYMNETKAAARETGYVTTIFGRRVHIPGIKDNNPARRAFSERAAINAPIQGSAADVIKRAMVRINPALADAGLAAKMLLQVHDELLFEVPEAEIEKTTEVVRRVMESAAEPVVELSVPLVADAGTGDSWAEAH
ncbi:DNA polymerase I [Nisaea acidiphila]|uniref:DNA polymerase I n=1 Tax=Nisaea acidiphila TaxID=1862145 RepID=A0A9J7B021_9PROT|nr:DNA polymerase I [Nisaea acidiphila]UUX51836.1 DNA polymerase I [Nisaea acidiphila]